MTLSGSNIDRSRNYNGPYGWSEMWVIARPSLAYPTPARPCMAAFTRSSRSRGCARSATSPHASRPTTRVPVPPAEWYRCWSRPSSIPLSPRPPGRSLRRSASASGSKVEGRGGCCRAWWCVGGVATPITARPRPGLRNAIALARSAMALIVHRQRWPPVRRPGGLHQSPGAQRPPRVRRVGRDRGRLDDPQRIAHEYQRRLTDWQASRGRGYGQGRAPHWRGAARDRAADRRLCRRRHRTRGVRAASGRLRARVAQLEEHRTTLAAAAQARRDLTLVIGRLDDFRPRSARTSTCSIGLPGAKSFG